MSDHNMNDKQHNAELAKKQIEDWKAKNAIALKARAIMEAEEKKKQNELGNLLVYFILAVCGFLLLLFISGAFDSSSNNGRSKSGEQRCWYCSKVIVNSQGTPIHKTNGKCDYCGKPN